MALFEGVSAFPPTPIDNEGVVDVDALQRRIARVADAGAESVCVLGSTGAYAYLDRTQRRRTIEAAVEAAGGTPVLAGIGALTTASACALARDALEAGAAAGLLAMVSYTPLTEAEVEAHVGAVANASDLPLCLYDNPVATRFAFSPELFGRLAALPTVQAAKAPAPADGDFAGLLARLEGSDLRLGFSGDATAAQAIRAGGAAWYSVTAGLFPRLALSLAQAARAGDQALVDAISADLQPLWTLLYAHGGVRVMSAAASRLGLGDFPPPRPLAPPPDEALASLAVTVERLAAREAAA
jgi:4-hydroxy-tetrahydrodipicolinate synthase